MVSPILPYRDGTPAQRQRVWRDIALVLGVIRRHGGGNDSRAGGHVHVGVGDYQRDVATMLRLIGLFRAHQDSLYRLATTPGETFTRMDFAEPLPEPEQDDIWGWADFGESRWSALSLRPLRRDYHAGRPAESDHVEARIFDGFLARQLGLGGAQARVGIIRALVDAALELSGTAAGVPADLGDSFLSQDPDVAAGAAALARLLGLLPDDADTARERVRRLWELTRWQPAEDWPPSDGSIDWPGESSIYWPAEVLPEEQWDGFSEVAARHPDRPVFMYVDSVPRVELVRMAVDRRTARGDEAEPGVIVAIVTEPGADSLDALPAALGVLLVRPAVPGAGPQPEPRLEERDGVTGWVSGTGWVLVSRGASGATTEAALGSFLGPEQLEQVFTGLPTPYQAGRLSGHRLMPLPANHRPGAVRALASLAGRRDDGHGGLREEIAQALFFDLYGHGSRYAAFLPAGLGRNRTIRLIRAGQVPDDQRILPLTLMIAADLLDRPITVIGPDAASSAEYGQDRPGDPIELIPVAVGGGLGRYLLAEPPADDETGAPDRLPPAFAPPPLSELVAAVRRNLRDLGWPGDLADDEIISVYEQLKEEPATGRGTAAQANSIALYIANGRSPVRMRGGGSGLEAEYTYLMTISDQPDLDQVVGKVLAYGPGGVLSVVVETKEFFRGSDGRYYRTEDAAESVTGTASAVKFAMPEFVSGVTRTFPGESGYHDHVPVFEALSRLEQILADLPGDEGSTPGIPLSHVLPEDFELTDLGRRTLIGPRPVGDWPGAHVHHTFGVPLTGLHEFLEHVRDNTWRDEDKGYLTRAHLADGLEFAEQTAFRFIMITYFPPGYRFLGFALADELARRSASEPAVAALRGYAALLYTGAATIAHQPIYKGLSKVNAAVLARHDMGQILAALPPEVRDYLRRNADDIMSSFERSFRKRIPDYDDQYRKRWFDEEEGDGPATINLLRPLVAWGEIGLLGSPANYLLGGLDPARALERSQGQYMMGMSTLPVLDTRHQPELGFALVVLEVRSYGARHVGAADARAQHERLATVVRELGARDEEIALVASVRQVIRESLARNPATLRLTLAAPLVAGHGRPGVIWQAALDFLRAEPAITSKIRFVEDAWREDGQRWNLIPLPAGIRQLLRIGGPTVTVGSSTAGRRTHTGPDPVPVRFPEGQSAEGDIPDSLELAALARWLAEEGAAPGASTPHGQLPQVRITGFGNGRRADATGARLLASVLHYLGQLGADPAIADVMLPVGQATGEAARRPVATVRPRPDGGTAARGAEPVRGDTVPIRSVAAARPDVRTVFLPVEAGILDLRPVRDLLRNERLLAAAPGGRGRPRRPVRIVVEQMPDGGAGEDVLAQLRREFAVSGREAYAPTPGSRVVVRDGDLAVVYEHGQPGRWVEVGSARRARRLGYWTLENGHLGRDLTDPAIAVTERELIWWMVRDSALPASLDPQPGESQRPFGLEVEFVFENGLPEEDKAERLQGIIGDLRRFGLTEQTTIGEAHSTRAAGYTSRRSGWRVEQDATVDGEVVSPILSYRGATAAQSQRVWHDVAVVLGVIRRHGGTTSSRAGGHVHVGVGDYQRNAGTMRRLIGLFRAHQDSLYRLATTPGEPYHRGLSEARPVPEPRRHLQGDAGEQGEWPSFGLERAGVQDSKMALNTTPLSKDWATGTPAGSDHIEFRLFDADLSLGGVQARADISRALADAAADPSRPAEDRASGLGDNFLGQNPYGQADAEALARVLDLFPAGAVQARERVRRLWELTRWQPPAAWPQLQGQFFWPAQIPPSEQWHGFSRATVRHSDRPVFMYVDSTTRLELLRTALDRWTRATSGDATARIIIVAIVGGSGSDGLDTLPCEYGVSLVRPAAPADWQWPEPRPAEQDGATGWRSDTGWVLVSRALHGAVTISTPLGHFFGPGELAQVLGQPGRARQTEDYLSAAPLPPAPPPLRPAVEVSPPGELEPGWEWLDDGRGIAVPTLDPALTGGDRTLREDWRAAVPGAGRGYAVHLPTAMIAAPVQDGDVTRYAVHEITDGWHHDGDDLVHRLTRAVLQGQAAIGMAGQDRWRGLFDEAEIQRQHPAPAARRGLEVQRRQLNREDLLGWLLGRGGLAGPVPGVAAGPGWQQVTEDGATRWVWNSPGEAALLLPPGMRIGRADGTGMVCLLDSLRQVMPVLPGQRREDMTAGFLRDWLEARLPEGNEARGQLRAGQMVDVWSVLPALTEAFQVRVQLFTHAEDRSRWGPLLEERPEIEGEWPGYETILPSELVGPAADGEGHQTPVLRLHWRWGHFEPVFDEDGPGGGQPAGTSAQRLVGLDGILRRRVLGYLERRTATPREIDLLTDVLGEAEGLAGGPPDQAWNQRISDGLELELLPAYFGEQSYTAELPGITTAELRQGGPILVPGLIRTHKNLESVSSGDVLYVIEDSPHGRDVSGLVGEGSDLVMFDRGQEFKVARLRDEDGRRTIVLRPTTTPAAESPAVEESSASNAEDSSQIRRQRSIIFNGSPVLSTDSPVNLDRISDLIAQVRRNLRGLRWPGDLSDDDIIRLYEQLKDDPATGRGTAAQANSIALYIANGGSPARMRGGGSGFEAEYTYLMRLTGKLQDVPDRAVMAYGPGKMFAITVEKKKFFQGSDGRYYRTEDGAENATGTARAVTFMMPEFVSGIARTFPGESGYQDHAPVFDALSRLEQILADLPGEGSLPGIPLSEVLPEDFELTDLGRRILVGPRPVGDWPGAHVHHTFGVPLTGLHEFLEHVRDHTWRDESRGYLTRAHLAAGLEFGERIAFGFIVEKYFPGGYPGFSTRDELARRCASEPAVAALRGYAALLYTGAATVAHSLIYDGLDKVNAAVLARHDMQQILAALPPEVRDYLSRNADDIMSRFERSFRSTIPDYDDQLRDVHFDEEEGGGPATIDLLRPPIDWTRDIRAGLPCSPANYLLGGLDPARAPQISQGQYMATSTLPGLDTRHEQELGLALVVLEVRSYGARHISAADARAQHEQLAAVVRGLRAGDARDQEIALVASVRQVIRESLARNPATLRLSLAAPLVAGHGRPDVIWLAALDFLRADPAITSQVRFVEDAWRDPGQPWNLIPLPAGIRQLLRVDGPTLSTSNSTAGRDADTSPDRVPEPVAVTFPASRSGEVDIPGSLELAALARWLAEAGAARGASTPHAGTPHGGQLPRVQITGFGDELRFDPTGKSARQTGKRRANAVRARLLASVRHYLGQLGADLVIADAMLPADQATGAFARNLTTREARRAVATVVSPGEERAVAVAEQTLSGWYVPPGGAGGHQGGARDLAAAQSFPPVEGAIVIHVHTDRVTGLLAAGGELLTAEEFYARVLAPRALEPGQLLVMVACGLAAARAGDLEPAAGVLARLGNWRVLAASADVLTTTSGRVVTARLGFGGDGRPVADTACPASWALFEPGAAEPMVFGPTDLAEVLALVMPLPGPPVPAGGHPDPASLAGAVRWAMGAEIERRNVRLFLPGGERLPEKTVLLRSRDGLVKVVVENKSVWLGQDGVLYESPEAMAAAGVAVDPQALSGGKFKIKVPEIVTVPWAVRAEPGRPDLDAVLARIRDVDQRWNRAPAIRTAIPGDGRSLTDLFPASHYEFTPESQHVRVVRLESVFAGAPLMVQLSVGVPLGGGVHAALEELYRGMDPGTIQAAALRAAIRFGWDVAGDYVDSAADAAPSPDEAGTLAPGWDVAEALTVAEVMALAFVQLRAVLTAQVPPEPIMKNRMAVVARHSLYEIWADLGPRLQAYFRDQRDVIRESFEAAFLGLVPDFAQRYNTKFGRTAGAPVDLWAVEFSDEYTGALLGTVGQLFDELLRPDPGGERIKQEVFDVARADSGGPDRSRGSGPGAPLPLVVLEMRSFAQSKYGRDERPGMSSMIDDQMMMDRIGRMTRMAARGDAAAESARRLPVTPEGQLVLTWLRQTAAEPEGALRDRTALNLRQAVAAYLARFPGERAVLGMTLGPFIEWLRLPDLVWAGRDEIRCSALAYVLGRAGHQATEQEIATVADLARILGMPARGEEQWLADLARVTGVLSLPLQARVSGSRRARASRAAVPSEVRLFRLLVLAASVFDDRSASRRGLVNLRLLVDLIGVASGEGAAEVALADLRAEYRLLYGLGASAPVSMSQLRELVALTGQVKARLLGSSPVTRTDLTARVGQMPRAGQPSAVGPADVSTLRLGDWLGVLRGRVLGYFDQLGTPTPGMAVIEQVTAVLAEALDLAGDDRGVLEWDALVGSGLRSLLPGSDRSYAGELPGIDPTGLAEGSQFTVRGLIRAHGSEGPVAAGGVVYVIVSPQGRDVSGLVGGGSDLVMFDRGQRFEVVRIIRGADGRPEIELRHPGHHASGAAVRAPMAASEPGAMVRAPGTGSCLLYAVIAAAPDVVREQLIERGLLTEDDPVAIWLTHPERVHRDSESLAESRSATGDGLPLGSLLWQAGERLRWLTLGYLQDNRAVLPEAVEQVRVHFLGSVGRQIRGLPDEGLIAALRRRGVTYVADAAYVRTELLREMYLEERRSELAGMLADEALSSQEMLDYLARRDVRLQLDVLDQDTLREYLLASSTLRSGPLDDIEFAAVKRAVATWEVSWASDEGEAFLPLLAHALGIQARVVQYRRQDPPGSGQWQDAAPFLLQTVGGEEDRAVDLYYDGTGHYNGSGRRQ